MKDASYYEGRIQTLERELDEMTVALSHAWDQLVPFLQDIPSQTETAQDIEPILYTVAAAVDTEMASIYLFNTKQWFSVPQPLPLTPEMIQQFSAISKAQTIEFVAGNGQQIYAVFAPVTSESQVIGVLGVGTTNPQRTFTTVNLRIVGRTAERIGQQIATAQLARFREREALRLQELQIANDIQQSVQPDNAPYDQRIQIASYWKPATLVGGDAWGWVQQSDDRVSWFILDVAGKGLPASLAAVALHTAITMALRMQLSPANVLNTVNAHLYDAYTRTDLMATAAVLTLNLHNGALEIANAGHPPILIRHGRSWLRLVATAPPLGVLPSLGAEPQHLLLQPFDLIICYSDGFTEIQTRDRLWGQTGLLRTIPFGAKKIKSLTQLIVAAAQRAGQVEDDQTLITAVYSPE
jgi:serine phosphatase RsbU (regulator of sigma subunit)